jgi:hypothetical protein
VARQRQRRFESPALRPSGAVALTATAVESSGPSR